MDLSRYYPERDDTLLLIIDIQERLFSVMDEDVQETVTKNTGILTELSLLYDIPIIVTEQYPVGLGHTVTEVLDRTIDAEPLEKLYFDCTRDDGIMKAIEDAGKKTVLVTGIETHVCVFQTVLSLLKRGYNVIIASDAVASRRKHDWKTALQTLREAGALVYPTESIAFLMLEIAGTQEFKRISPLFK